MEPQMPRKYTPEVFVEKFWQRVDRSKPDGCWEWQAGTARGYGWLIRNGKTAYAHRVSWEFHNGPIPDGLYVLHQCDNPLCANPKHLFLGTQRDNMLDMIAKGRYRGGGPKGERCAASRLTEDAVREIRASTLSTRALAERYNVHDTTIRRARSRKYWLHVE
jgi:hypothetical protein